MKRFKRQMRAELTPRRIERIKLEDGSYRKRILWSDGSTSVVKDRAQR